jgi:hypothetical protein
MIVDFSVVVLQNPASNHLKLLFDRDRGIYGFEPGRPRQYPIST